jgi:hypothetical protein
MGQHCIHFHGFFNPTEWITKVDSAILAIKPLRDSRLTSEGCLKKRGAMGQKPRMRANNSATILSSARRTIPL